MQDIATLNAKFARPDQVRFVAGPGGLPVAEITTGVATAAVCLHGAHVTAFQPQGEKPVIWLSRKAVFQSGKPIRGGIPLCWPNFGPAPVGSPLPPHGLARLRRWQVVDVVAHDTDRCDLRLALAADDASRELWPHDFALELQVAVGRRLAVALTIRNPGSSAFTCTDALHTYFAVSDVAGVRVSGLERCTYRDTVPTPPATCRQEGPVTFGGNVDRVYLDTTATCVIHDPKWKRRIAVTKQGSRSTVVWTPWEEKAAAMADLGSGKWHGMLCVETANAGPEDAVTVPPGGTHTVSCEVSVLSGAD